MPDRAQLSDHSATPRILCRGCEASVANPFGSLCPRCEVERLRRLLWECHCAASDGVPVPFERWLNDGGPDGMPADVRELREAYDTVSEREYKLSKVPAAMITRIQEAADIVDAEAVSRTSGTLLKMAVVLALEFAGASDENQDGGEN